MELLNPLSTANFPARSVAYTGVILVLDPIEP